MMKKYFIFIGLFLVFCSILVSAVLTDDLVSYYKFDGDLLDAHGSNNGTNDGTTNVSGKIGSARQFDGSTNQINLGSGFSPTTAMTWNTWIYRDDTSDGFIGGKWLWDTPDTNGRAFAMDITSNNLTFWISSDGTHAGSSSVVGNTTLSATTWYMVTGTFDGSNLKVYLNGVYIGITAKSSGISDEPWDTYLGIQNGGSTEYSHFDGVIDEVFFSDSALNSTEILELYNSGLGLAYPFEEEEETCWTKTAGKLIIPPTCQFYTSIQEALF